jgi:hypothetical protein
MQDTPSSKSIAATASQPYVPFRAAKVAQVVFIDYGSTEKIAWSNLRPLEQSLFGTQKLKGQASDASLSPWSNIRVPPESRRLPAQPV